MPHHASNAVDLLRWAPWITGERMRRWGRVLAATTLALLIWDIATHTALGITDAAGEHVGRDFINYWAGARWAAEGRAVEAFDFRKFHAFEQSLAGPASEFKLYGYPPVLMLLTLPLAPLPFLAALALWTALGLGLAAALLSRQTGWRIAILAMIAAPAGFLNILSGQNGYFSAALLGGGLTMLERRPVVAGVLLGLLSYKPQLGVLLPVALATGRCWTAFAAAAATVAALFAASLALFGWESWIAFYHQMAVQRELMELGTSFWPRMPTVFAAMRELGAGLRLAYAAQAVSAVAAAVAVTFAWHRSANAEIKAAALAVALFLATPYAWDYDMPVLIFAAAWLAGGVARDGSLPWERITGLALLMLPWPMIILSKAAGLPIGPIILWLSLLVLLRRAAKSERPALPHAALAEGRA